ncbi:hypothetical protein [Streptomyces sp. NPDC053560]|uniref:hypothetical protein n=1 Tax=Streptomyces sp. NPDC053560 TaxID=3365711 RepID=UPI0037CFE77F
MALAWQIAHRGVDTPRSGPFFPFWAGAALLALSVGGSARPTGRLRQGLRASRRLRRELQERVAARTPDEAGALKAAVLRAGMQSEVVVFDAAAPCAFTYGLLCPRGPSAAAR